MFEDISKIVLLSDMDGTLLNSKKLINEVDLAAIQRFTDLGGHFTVATGRTLQAFERYRDSLKLNMPVILYNGAAIYDYSSGKALYTHPLPDECRNIAKEVLEAMPDAGGEVLKLDGTYVFRNNDYQKLHTKLCGITPFYSTLDEIPEGGWLKVLFAMAPDDMEYIEILVRQKNYETVSFVKSSEMFYEMLPVGVSKGSALLNYRRLDGMTDFKFVAIGDFDNDIEMIREADLGVCPANAEESVKKASDLVLNKTNDEGAVAELINHIINKCEKF